MCGIVGCVLKTNAGLTRQAEDIFNQLVFANTLRGDDSTGVIGVEKDTTFHIAKEASPGYWFLPLYDATKMSKNMFSYGKALIGHNRKKTIGAVSDETAHPFVENDEFAMVHNGTLHNHRSLANTEVDSQALTQVLAKAFEKADYKADLEETLGKVFGAYAVAMYDQRHNKVRLLRNSERPLAMVETSNATYFASEAAMLLWVLGRNGIDFSKHKVEAVPVHTVIEFDLDNNTVERTVVEPKKATPPATTKTHTHQAGGNTTATGIKFKRKQNTTEEGLSKNAFKKFRRKFLGKRIEWWCEDYIETNFPRTEVDGETLFTITGVSDDLAEDHLIKALADLKELNFPRGRDLCDRLWSGVITGMIYEKRAKKVVLEVDVAIPVPVSALGKPKDKQIPAKGTYDSVECTTNVHGEPCKKYWKGADLIAELTFGEIYGVEKETQPTVH